MVIILFILGIIISLAIANFIVKILAAPFLRFLKDLFDEERADFWFMIMKLIIYLVSLAGSLTPPYHTYLGKPQAFQELFWGLIGTIRGSVWRIVMVLVLFFICFLITSSFLKKEKPPA